ncbi:MAG: porin family protein [Bacteroidia bacterium]
MKKVITILSVAVITCCASTSSFAQTFGLKFGANLANMITKLDKDKLNDNSKIIAGMHLGPIVEFSLNDMFSIESGILGTIKGSKSTSEMDLLGVKYETKSRLYLLYVEVPVTAKVGFKAGNSKIYVDAGPYIALGTMGKSIVVDSKDGKTEHSEVTDMKWGNNNESDLKRLDYGVTAGAGIEFGIIQISASYGLGLANIAPKYLSDLGFSMKNNVIGISLAFRFGANK